MDSLAHVGTSDQLIGAPKSVKIACALEAEIRAGRLGRGAALQSEHALVKRFSVSRNTIRKSLEILSQKGLITTKSGIGSFVTYAGRTIDDHRGWSLALASEGNTLATRVLRIDRAPMDFNDAPPECQNLCLCVDRLRFQVADGRAVSLERSRVLWRAGFDEILRAGLTSGSLTETLQSRGLTVASGDEWANVLPSLEQADASALGRRAGEPMLELRRLTRAADGSVIEYVKSILDPLRFGLHMAF